VGMGFVFTGTGMDGVQFLSPCRPLDPTNSVKVQKEDIEYTVI